MGKQEAKAGTSAVPEQLAWGCLAHGQLAQQQPTGPTHGQLAHGQPTGPTQKHESHPCSTAATRGINSFALKIIAIVAMTCNHAAWVFAAALPAAVQCVLLAVGGLTFPIMLFLLHVGYAHTRSVKNYALRLVAFALLAQIPFWLFLQHAANVLFTLLMCLGVFYLYDKWGDGAKFWTAFTAILLLSCVCDWGVMGPAMALVLHTAPSQKRGALYSALVPIVADGLLMLLQLVQAPSLVNLGLLLYPLLGCGATVPLLQAYNGQRGRPLKWFFYLYYPVHIAVLGCLKLALGL